MWLSRPHKLAGMDGNRTHPGPPQQRPADGFEDPWGRVEFRTGPFRALTQRSINRLGVRRIVFPRPPLCYLRASTAGGVRGCMPGAALPSTGAAS